MIARRGLELEKNFKERLDRLEQQLGRWQDLLHRLEAKIQFLEHQHLRF